MSVQTNHEHPSPKAKLGTFSSFAGLHGVESMDTIRSLEQQRYATYDNAVNAHDVSKGTLNLTQNPSFTGALMDINEPSPTHSNLPKTLKNRFRLDQIDMN